MEAALLLTRTSLSNQRAQPSWSHGAISQSDMNGLPIECSSSQGPVNCVAVFSGKWKWQELIQASAVEGRNSSSQKYVTSKSFETQQDFSSRFFQIHHTHTCLSVYLCIQFARKYDAAHINPATQLGEPTAGNPERKPRQDTIGSCSFHNPIESTCFCFENFADVCDRNKTLRTHLHPY